MKGNSESVTLRAVEPADESFLAAVYASTRTAELAQTSWTEAEKIAFCRSQFAAQDAHYRKHYPAAQFLVMEREGVPIGRLYVDRWEREIRIMDITLLPEHRGNGIGTRFFRQLQEEAATAKKVLSIHVEKFNPARKLYERLGFVVREDKGIYLLMDWKA